jgi:hypothetical protein
MDRRLGVGKTTTRMARPLPPSLLRFLRHRHHHARPLHATTSAADTVTSVSDAHGIERPGAVPFLSPAGKGLGLLAAPSSSSSSSSGVAARVPLSLCLSTDAALISCGACGPPPAECLPPQVRRLLPEAGCCHDDDDGEAAWEVRLGALQLLMSPPPPPPPGAPPLPPLPPLQARSRAFWSAWRVSGALPTRGSSLLCWSTAELELLGDAFLAASARAWRREAEGAFERYGLAALVQQPQQQQEQRALDEYLWAVSAVASRAFALEQEEEEEEEEEEEGRARPRPPPPHPLLLGRAAVPFIDLANHGGGVGRSRGAAAATANCRVRVASASGLVELLRCGGGGGGGGEEQEAADQEEEELLISYGPDKPSRSLMERYGFCPEGGCGSDRVDWREVAGLAPIGDDDGIAPAPAPPPRDELRRLVLRAGGLVLPADAPLPLPLSRAALAATEARVLAAGHAQAFGPQHLERAGKSVARLFGWRNKAEFLAASRGGGAGAGSDAASIGRALAVAAKSARLRAEQGAARVLEADASRAELAAAYRAERASVLMALAALGEALAASAAAA